MLLKSQHNIANKGSLFLEDLRDLEKEYCFSFQSNIYTHKLDELNNTTNIQTFYKDSIVLFPSFTCSCNNYTETGLVINNFCIHLKQKTLSLHRKKLSSLSYLLLKDFNDKTITYKFLSEEKIAVYTSILPYKKYIIFYYPNEENIYKKIKYYPIIETFEFGVVLSAEQKILDLIQFIKNEVTIEYAVVKTKKS